MMTGQEFREAQRALGWSNARTAEALLVHPNRVSAWRLGRARVPGPAEAYMRERLALREVYEAIGRIL